MGNNSVKSAIRKNFVFCRTFRSAVTHVLIHSFPLINGRINATAQIQFVALLLEIFNFFVRMCGGKVPRAMDQRRERTELSHSPIVYSCKATIMGSALAFQNYAPDVIQTERRERFMNVSIRIGTDPVCPTFMTYYLSINYCLDSIDGGLRVVVQWNSTVDECQTFCQVYAMEHESDLCIIR